MLFLLLLFRLLVFLKGDGVYRIGLYVQDDDDFQNEEYLLLNKNSEQLQG